MKAKNRICTVNDCSRRLYSKTYCESHYYQAKRGIVPGFINTPTMHNMSQTRFYRIYVNMDTRCNNSKHGTYKRYGARGIRCRWNNFSEFKEDMYKSYLKHSSIHGEKNTTLDRIDGSKSYSRDNCRWATYAKQARNTKTNRYLTYKGKTMCIADWAEYVGLKKTTLFMRLYSYNWSIEDALTKGVNQ